jgi:hypothetical protein
MTKEIDYVELLKLAHEKLGSQSDMIELLKSKLAGSKYTLNLFCVKYKELEKEKAEYVPVLTWIARECNQVDGGILFRLKSYLAIRDLEQQAKGLSEGFHATKEPIGRNAFGFMMHYCSEKNLKDRVDDLRIQSKALRDES